MPTDETALAKDIVGGVEADAVSRMEWEGGVQAARANKIDLASFPEGTVLTREALNGGGITHDEIRAAPWECDCTTGNYIKRAPEFFVARAEAEEALVQQRKDAEIILASAMLSLEPDLPTQIDAVPLAVAANGAAHAIVASEPKVEGGGWAGLSRTPAAAVAAYKRALLSFVAKHTGDTLWWRIRPEIDALIHTGETQPYWIVYSRLTIGNLADTFIERVKCGKIFPSGNDVKDNLITAAKLAELGLTEYDVGTDRWYPPGHRRAE
jgi:hypothetical protein